MSEDTGPERLLGGYPGRLLWLLAFGFTAGMVGRLVLSPMLPTIIDELGVSPARAGIALSVMWGLVALSQYPGGRLADQLSRKTVLVAGLALLFAGGAVLLLARGFPGFVAGVALIGVGGGLYPPAAFAQLSDLFVEKRGQAFGVISGSVNFGGVLAAALAPFALAASTWRSAYLPVLLALSSVALVVHVWHREGYAIRGATLDVRGTVRRLATHEGLRPMFVAAALFAITWQATASFLPTYLRAAKGFPPGMASNAFAAVFVVGMAANPVAGRLVDYAKPADVAAGASAVGLVGLGAVLFATSTRSVGAAIVVFAFGLAAFWPALNAYLMSAFVGASRGGDFGAFRTLYIVVGSLGPAYVGIVAERASYELAFAGLAVCLVGVLAVTLWLR